jgi:tetratricopeptide (TPR) repeat protein
LADPILDEGLRRRPHSAAIAARLAEVHEAAGLKARVEAKTSIETAAGEGHLIEADRLSRRAVELYPTRAEYRYLLGRILDDAGRSAEAAAEFREALRLSALAKRVRRLALDGLQAAVATQKTGGDGVNLLREWLKTQPPERWNARRATLTPVEKAIVDAATEPK